MRIIKFLLVDFVEAVLVCFMVALCAVIAWGVYTRYVMGQAASWYDELARYLFIWISFLGAAVAVRRRAHFVVHIFVNRLHKKMQFIAELLCWVIIMGFSIFITIQGLRVLEGVSVQISPALGITLVWVFVSIPIHGILSLVYAGGHLWHAIQVQLKGGNP